MLRTLLRCLVETVLNASINRPMGLRSCVGVVRELPYHTL
ncbi:MAG: hypothetical protein OJF50_001912 [Nitrospira sp.]|nr:hypothetical protein [Nitrospira sp.]